MDYQLGGGGKRVFFFEVKHPYALPGTTGEVGVACGCFLAIVVCSILIWCVVVYRTLILYICAHSNCIHMYCRSAGDPTKRKPFLPPDKQFLVTKNGSLALYVIPPPTIEKCIMHTCSAQVCKVLECCIHVALKSARCWNVAYMLCTCCAQVYKVLEYCIHVALKSARCWNVAYMLCTCCAQVYKVLEYCIHVALKSARCWNVAYMLRSSLQSAGMLHTCCVHVAL